MRQYHVDVVSIGCSIWFLLSAYSSVASFSTTAFTLSKQHSISPYLNHKRQQKCDIVAALHESSAGNAGGRKNIPVDKTYETNSYKHDIIIDQEGAMLSFFNSREEWLPLFRSVAGNDLPKDTISLLNTITTTTLNDVKNDSTTTEANLPWKQYDAIPSDEDDRAIVARFLDSMQESLLAIPVLEDASRLLAQSFSDSELDHTDDEDDDDENDKQFVEEGRRLLAINRFHVLSSCSNGTNSDTNIGSIESVDELFRYCWSEILMLSQEGMVNSGSLLLLPQQYDLPYVRQFLDMNIIQPLQWLGIRNDYEITSFQRDSPVIRIIYKLNDIPTTTSYTEEDGFAANN